MLVSPEALALGLGIGLILGLTGAGGGVLAVPGLVLGLGFTLPAAAPVALFAVGAAAAIGAWHGWRRREVRYRAAMVLALLGAISAPFGVSLAGLVPKPLLTLLFGLVMVLVAVRMLMGTLTPARSAGATAASARVLPCRIDALTGRLRWTPACVGVIGLIGALTGFCSGLLGVGGGFIIVPALTRFSDIKTHQIIATSLLAIALIAASSVASALWHGVAIDSVGVDFIAGSIAGMVAGRVLISAVPPRRLLQGFSVLMLLVAALLVQAALH